MWSPASLSISSRSPVSVRGLGLRPRCLQPRDRPAEERVDLGGEVWTGSDMISITRLHYDLVTRALDVQVELVRAGVAHQPLSQVAHQPRARRGQAQMDDLPAR